MAPGLRPAVRHRPGVEHPARYGLHPASVGVLAPADVLELVPGPRVNRREARRLRQRLAHRRHPTRVVPLSARALRHWHAVAVPVRRHAALPRGGGRHPPPAGRCPAAVRPHTLRGGRAGARRRPYLADWTPPSVVARSPPAQARSRPRPRTISTRMLFTSEAPVSRSSRCTSRSLLVPRRSCAWRPLTSRTGRAAAEYGYAGCTPARTSSHAELQRGHSLEASGDSSSGS